jgi:hypothetical protein
VRTVSSDAPAALFSSAWRIRQTRNAGVTFYDEYPVPELNTDTLEFALAPSLFDDA